MIKSELVARIAERHPHLLHKDAERIVATIFDEIASALSRGDRVELRGFGPFSVKARPARAVFQDRQGLARKIEHGRRCRRIADWPRARM